jgi:hypothetical protein
MFVRGIYQYNSLEKRAEASVLFAYEYSPLSNIFIGTNLHDLERFGDLGDQLELFAKIGYLWRL